MKEVKHFIDGQYITSVSGETLDDINPINNEVIAKIPIAGKPEVNAAVIAAKRALTGEWGAMEVPERLNLLYKLADGINARFDEFLEAECLDTGKPYSLARHIDIPRGAANFKIFADTVKNLHDQAFHMPTPDGKGALNYTQHQAKGVIAVIGPWNLPLLLMTWKVGPALACGNTVVVKPSEETPLTTALLGEVANEVGLPKGVFNVVHGTGAVTGQELVKHPAIDAITFTGSTATGQRVMEAASVGVRNISLELGGKNAAVVFADCDIDKTIEGTMRSVFANCGQVCLGTERVYVQRGIFKLFVQRLKEGAEGLVLGDPTAHQTKLGPLISQAHKNKVLRYYEQAEKEGAVVVTGGKPAHLSGPLSQGHWVEPTIWTGLPEDSPIIKEEIFGPCCHIAPFDTEAEAIALANDTPYGLAAALWTENSSRAHRVAVKLNAGIVWVNSWFLRDLRTPFGGMKASGIGREGGAYSLEFYTELKNICIKL